MGIPLYLRIPFSPSIKVMSERHDPVFAYPESRVIIPVSALSFRTSIAFSPAVPSIIDVSYSFPSYNIFAIDIDCPLKA